MSAVRESWTDERLDELNRKVDDGFAHIDQRFGQVDQRFEQVDQRFEHVDRRFDQVDRRLDRLEDGFGSLQRDLPRQFEAMRDAMDLRFDAVQRNLIYALVGISGVMLTVLAGIVGALIMQT